MTTNKAAAVEALAAYADPAVGGAPQRVRAVGGMAAYADPSVGHAQQRMRTVVALVAFTAAPANDCWVWDGTKEVPASVFVWDGAVEVPTTMEVV